MVRGETVNVDHQRFDAALRALGRQTTRRQGIAAAAGVLFGMAGGAAVAGSSEPAGTEKSKGPCGNGSRKDNACKGNASCCTKFCVKGRCRCKPNFMICQKHEHCCSGSCVQGRCDGGCVADGQPCSENFNCCNGSACVRNVCKQSSKASCDASSCGGCCEGTVCRSGVARDACGASPGTCATCLPNEICTNGVCTPLHNCRATCAGCCAYGVCYPGTDASRCGPAGAYCATCGGATPVCVNGVCTGCQSDSDCTSPTPTCSSGVCTGCQSDGDCANPTPTCTSGLCTGCADDSQCPGSAPFCSSYRCKECLTTGDCSATGADACSAGACRCGAGAACSGSTPLCSSGTCIGCISNSDCSGSTPVCSSGTCVGCVSDSDCSGENICCSGSCTAGAWAAQITFGLVGNASDELNSPQGIAVTADGLTALIADKSNHRIAIWARTTAAGTDWTDKAIFGSGPGSGAAQFDKPTGVVLSPDGLTAYVSDKNNNRVSIWSRGSTGSNSWSHVENIAAGTVASPQSLAIDAAGTKLWIDDFSNDQFAIWSESGGVWSAAGTFGSSGSGANEFSGPYGVAVNGAGGLAFIADTLNDRITVWDKTGGWSELSSLGQAGNGASQFNRPRGVFAAANGKTVWVADTNNNRVSIWSESGGAWTNQTTFGTRGSGASNLASPAGVFLSADGLTAWVVDEGNNRIAVWTVACPT